jgi:hypothetical protein
LGENSIVVYLAFFLFMAFTRTVLLRFAPNLNLTIVAILSTSSGVVGPIVLNYFTKNTALDFLFKRPSWARLADNAKQWHTGIYVSNRSTKSKPAFKPETR